MEDYKIKKINEFKSIVIDILSFGYAHNLNNIIHLFKSIHDIEIKRRNLDFLKIALNQLWFKGTIIKNNRGAFWLAEGY